MPKFKIIILLIISITSAMAIPKKNRSSSQVHACISTVGWREDSLKLAIESILPQVDKVFVFLQFYNKIPAFLKHEKITVAEGNNYPEVLAFGSSAKFLWADKIKGYYITIDDDIIYPPNYVKYCIKKIESYKRKAIVGFHGSIFNNNLSNFQEKQLCYYHDLNEDTFVHMLGTGVMAYHTDTIKISMIQFETKNQDDLWFAMAAQQQQIPMVCLKRNGDYIKIIKEVAYDPRCISAQNPKSQARLAKSFAPWKLNTF